MARLETVSGGAAADGESGRAGGMGSRLPLRKAGVGVVLFFCVCAVLAPWISPYERGATDTPFQPPSARHWLGTDDVGQDVLSELIRSARVSLPIGLLAALLAVAIGVGVGVVSGFYRGLSGELLVGVTDIFILIPGLPFLIILSSYLRPSFWNVIAVVGVLWWTPTARVIHARTIQIRELPYIESTRALGYSRLYQIRRHVLPNLTDLVWARFSIAVASAMLTETSLSFIGLVDPVKVSWGQMIHYAFARGGFANHMWWWYLPPGVAISTCVLGFTMLGMERRRQPAAVRWL